MQLGSCISSKNFYRIRNTWIDFEGVIDMKKCFRMILACVTVTAALVGTVHAAETVATQSIELLWPNGAPGAKGSQEGDKPTLTICLPDKETTTGTAVVICPGGGYGHLAMDHEGNKSPTG